jgi:hypothetical protein
LFPVRLRYQIEGGKSTCDKRFGYSTGNGNTGRMGVACVFGGIYSSVGSAKRGVSLAEKALAHSYDKLLGCNKYEFITIINFF